MTTKRADSRGSGSMAVIGRDLGPQAYPSGKSVRPASRKPAGSSGRTSSASRTPSFVFDVLVLVMFLGCVWQEARITGSGIVVGSSVAVASGYPRISEVAAILLAGYSFCVGSRSFHWRNIHTGLLCFAILGYVFGMGLLLGPEYTGNFGQYRSGVLIPTLLFFAVSRIELPSMRVRRYLVVLVLTQLVSALTLYAQRLGRMDFLGTFSSGDTEVRYWGYSVGQTYLAFMLATTLPFLMLMVIHTAQSRRWVATMTWAVLLCVLAAAVTLTGIRTAALAIAASMAIVIVIAAKSRMSVLLPGLLVASAVVASLVLLTTRDQAFDEGVMVRVDAWRIAIGIAIRHPLGVGTGEGYFEQDLNAEMDVFAHAQNDLLYVAATQGWLTLLAYLYVYAWCIPRYVFKLGRRGQATFTLEESAVAGIYLLWVFWGVTEITTAVIYTNGVSLFFVGCLYAQNNCTARQIAEKTQIQVNRPRPLDIARGC